MSITIYLLITIAIGEIFAITQLYQKWYKVNFIDGAVYVPSVALFSPIVVPFIIGLFVGFASTFVIVGIPMYAYYMIRDF